MSKSSRRWAVVLTSAAMVAGGAAGMVSAGPASAAPAPLKITTTSLPTALEGNGYSQTLKHSGGTGRVTFQVADGVPGYRYYTHNGLTLEPSGFIHGTAGSTEYTEETFRATDSGTPQQTVTVTIPWITESAAITTTSLPIGRVWVPYPTTTFGHLGCGVLTEFEVALPLPAGMKFSKGGQLSGTPMTTYSFTNEFVFDNAPAVYISPNGVADCEAFKDLLLTILPMGISQPKPITTTVAIDKAYPAFTEKNLGGKAPFKWSISTGALPAGMKVNASNGQITGTPTVAGTCSFTIQLADSASNVATQDETITVTP